MMDELSQDEVRTTSGEASESKKRMCNEAELAAGMNVRCIKGQTRSTIMPAILIIGQAFDIWCKNLNIFHFMCLILLKNW